jgi:glycosyltransferase involved in cell wall biosynthesis
MKILFYNHTGQIGGAERVLMTIVEHLDRRRFEPIVICPTGPLHEQLSTAVPTEVAEVLHARFTFRPDHFIRYLASFVRVILQLRRRVIRLDPDLIHANSVRAGLVMTAATVGLHKPVLWHIHDLLPRRHPFNPFIRWFAGMSRRTRIIAVAQASADRFAGSLLPLKNRVTVIPNGIDIERFRPCRTTRRTVRNELNLRENQKVIGVIGRLTPSKGQLEILHAFAELGHRFPDAMLLIVGAPAFNREQEYAELLEHTVRDLRITDRVRLLGERDDVASIMQALDLLVLNSSSEACSLVLLEAMAAGVAVTATNVGGTPEIIDHGETGWLVPPQNHDLLSAALLAIMQDENLRTRLGNGARQAAVTRFSESRFLRDISGFYSQFHASSTHDLARPFFSKKLATD